MDVKDMNATPVFTAPQNIPPVNSAASTGAPKKSSGRFLFLIIGLAIGVVATSVIVLTLGKAAGGFGKSAKLEGSGYDTPEEAVMAYAEYLKAGDFDGMLSTFAMESYIENYSVEEYLDEFKAFCPYNGNAGIGTNGTIMLDDSDFSREVNLDNRRSYFASNVSKQYLIRKFVGADEDGIKSLFQGLTMVVKENDTEDMVLDFLSYYPDSEEIEIGDFLDSSDFRGLYTDNLRNYTKLREKIMGGDIEDVCLELEIDGEDYVLFVTCVCYDDRWYIADFGNFYGSCFDVPYINGGLNPADDLDL